MKLSLNFSTSSWSLQRSWRVTSGDLKEDTGRSESKIFGWKKQSVHEDPMSDELEIWSLRAPIHLIMEDIKIITEFNPCHTRETISSEKSKIPKAFQQKNFQVWDCNQVCEDE